MHTAQEDKTHSCHKSNIFTHDNERHDKNMGKCLSHNELQRFVLFFDRKTANRVKPLQIKSLDYAMKMFWQ